MPFSQTIHTNRHIKCPTGNKKVVVAFKKKKKVIREISLFKAQPCIIFLFFGFYEI